MPEYINKQEILEKAKALQGSPFGSPGIVREIEKADGIDIVRCKECKHFATDTDYCKVHRKGYCIFDNTIKSKKHFCSYGERKEK